MSFRIHSTPIQPTPCMIRVNHHQLPKTLALAKLEAELDAELAELEEEYEDEPEHVEPPKPTPHYNLQPAPTPLPPVVLPPVDETFKLRRKRRA